MELESVPGVGEKTANALRTLENPEQTLRDGDVAALARAPGVSAGRAAHIARAAIRKRHGESATFAATGRAREMHREALSLLQERAVTDYGKHRLETFYPSSAESRIEEVRTYVAEAMEHEPDETVLTALSGVSPLTDPPTVRVRERCLATRDAETHATATETIPELSVELVEDTRQLAELARGYSTVIALDEAFVGTDLPGDVRVEPNALSDPVSVVPERTLAFFARNREAIRAAAVVHQEAELETPCDLDALEEALSVLEPDGSVKGDAELERLSNAVDDLDTAVSEGERLANAHLREAIEARDVTIEGTDLLSMAERGAGVESLLERELAGEFETAIERARNTLVETLALQETERLAQRVFRENPTYPIERDDRAVSTLREELTAKRDRRAATRKRETAETLAAMGDACEQLISRALELDVQFAIARFAQDFDCTLPQFGGDGIEIENGRSPLLDVPFAEVQPVSYGVEGVTLLSGVNSGGKTSLLDLIGLIVTLAHMGLPVPAERARIERIDELHYYAKSQGTLDAGAFESTLREFGELVTDVSEQKRVLVLVDELESITEPGASAIIVAGILEALAERDATAVFVSHLAREIRETAGTAIAVDGIEARGLEDGELLVNRSPVKGELARSTPELIVEKLATGTAEQNGFYDSLLEKF